MTTALVNPIRRLVDIRGQRYVVELSRAGVMFRKPGHRRRSVAPLRAVLELAESLDGQALTVEQLRAAALRRHGGRRK